MGSKEAKLIQVDYMKESWIFGGAPIADYSCINISEKAVVIAADGGYDHLKKINIYPDYIIGDLDSYKGDLPDECEIITAPVRKDDTDMMLAVKKALEIGCDKIFICGALGGRLDHTIANIQTLEYIFDNGGYGVVVDYDNIVSIQDKGILTYEKMDGWYFSVFSLTEKSELSLAGTSFETENCILTRGFPLGVSNEIILDNAIVNLFSGRLLIIRSRK